MDERGRTDVLGKTERSGVDGKTAKDYEAKLEENLGLLLDRAKAGTYRAPPVRRVHIPKGDGETTRPIGIPTFEDKVLQRAVLMALEPIYEQDFKDCSFGFRRQRSAHQALQSFWKQMMDMGGGWVVEVDIKKFFDTLDHRHLQTIVRQRVRDGVLLRLIGKWLFERGNAGGRGAVASRVRYSAGRSHLPPAREHLPPRGARHVV